MPWPTSPLHNGWRGALLGCLGFATLAWPEAVALLLVLMGMALIRDYLAAPGGRGRWF